MRGKDGINLFISQEKTGNYNLLHKKVYAIPKKVVLDGLNLGL
jgi:hypothetical protein